jgi:hypothetical protein
LEVFQALERLVRDAAAGSSAGGTGRWEEVERAWVLFPPSGVAPRGVVHFCGGAFAGASPQLTYRLLLETLCAKGSFVIVATPYVTTFDHLRVADEVCGDERGPVCAHVPDAPTRPRPAVARLQVQFTFDRAFRALAPRLAPGLPVWGMGALSGAAAPRAFPCARAFVHLICHCAGHSMGALAQCLISSRYAVTRAGNVLMSAWRG